MTPAPVAGPEPVPGTYPRRAGNRLRPLIDAPAAFAAIGAAIDAARRSIGLTVAFCAEDFRFPDDGSTLFDRLGRATARGVEVRMLAWRPDAESMSYGRSFAGTAAERAALAARGARISIRWDRAPAGHVQHQKSWIIDAGTPGETGFVGGINLTAQALERHDLYLGITGPAATDVQHNFVQRWNEASERARPDGWWGPDGATALPFPAQSAAPAGTSPVQIQRMMAPGRYADAHPTPGGAPHAIAGGERGILDQYVAAIAAARATILVVNQALPVPEVAGHLLSALRRGVQVVLLVPAEPEAWVRRARADPAQAALFDGITALQRCDGFTLAGLAQPGAAGPHPIYVHAKAMLVDDAWATIGSCNLHARSLGGHGELNASIWDGAVVRALRCALLHRYLGIDTGDLDDRAALALFAGMAARNRRAVAEGAAWQGLAIGLDAAGYGR